LPTDARWRLEFCEERRVIAAVNTLWNIDLQQILGAKFEALKDRRDSLPTGPSGAKAIAVGRQFGVPLGLQGLAYQRLPRPVVLGWNA
jgi:hypothetical protein